MIDKEKVLTGIKACADHTGALCRTCPYDFRKESCISDMAEDALELLKEQPEIIHCKDCENWIPGKIDPDNFEAPRCKRNVGIWVGDDFCSRAERKVNQG